MYPVVGQDKHLLRDVPKNSNTLQLLDRIDLSPGDILMIDTDHPELLEYQVVEDVSGYSTPDQPATITLTYPVAFSHRRGAMVKKAIPQAPGPDNPFSQDAIAGDSYVFLTSMHDLDSPSVIAVSGGGDPVEFHNMQRFSATSDSDGYFRLPPLSRVAQLEIHAVDSSAPPAGTQSEIFSPNYTHRKNRIDFIFR